MDQQRFDSKSTTTEDFAALSKDSSLCQPIRPRDTSGHVTAYLILAHSTETLEGARLLVEQIYDPRDLFLIHVDAKLNGTRLWETVRGMKVCENIEFVPHNERVDVRWGKMVSFELVSFSIRVEDLPFAHYPSFDPPGRI